jgi:DNA-binding CsgD family transcriptional regulator
MPSITASDLRSIFGFLGVASEPAAAQPFPRPVLGRLGDVIAADWIEYFEMRRADKSALAYTVSVDLDDPPEIDWAWDQGLFRDNPIGAFKWTPADGPRRLSAMVGPRAVRGLGYYQGYLRPLGIRDQLKVWLWSSERSVACVVLNRVTGSFSDHDVAVLGVLQQHLIEVRAAALASATVGPSADALLTPREAQVLTWAAAGRQTREIAELLFIAPATARKHLENAYAKLGVNGRGEALATVMRLTSRNAAPRD